MGGVRTLYARTGDLFAWLCVAFLSLALSAAWLKGGSLEQVSSFKAQVSNLKLQLTSVKSRERIP
jgi:hypothetical protein